MRDYYTIGEVSKIMGVSVQTLRYYNSIDLLVPAHVNRRTGYRYYTEDQFHRIDRIKYLQSIGMSLSEIRNLLGEQDVPGLMKYLEDARKNTEEKIRELTDLLDTIEWHEQYFRDCAEGKARESLYSVQHLPVRYLAVCEVADGEAREDSLRRLDKKLRTEPFRQMSCCGRPEYVLDYAALSEDKRKVQYLGMPMEGIPNPEDSDILEIPEGDYFCFTARILGKHWSAYPAKMYFCGMKEQPEFAVARELENRQHEYSEDPFEIQIRIPKDKR